jgi:hypothetical protein
MANPVTESGRKQMGKKAADKAVAQVADLAADAGPGVIARVADGTASTLGTAAGIAGFAPLATGLVAGVGGGIAWAGSKMRLGVIEKAGDKLRAPNRFLNEKTVGDVAGKIPLAGKMGAGAEWAANRSGIAGWRINAHENRAAMHHGAAQRASAQLSPHVHLLEPEVRAHVHTLQKAVGSHPGAIDTKQFEESYKALEALGKKHDLKPLAKPLKQLNKSLTRSSEHLGHAAKWRDVRGAIRGRSLGSTLMDGSFVLGSALGAYGVARSFSQKLDSLKEMEAAVTGKKVEDISTMAVLTGNVPKVVAEARSHLIKEHGFRGLIEGAGLFLTARGFARGNIPMKAFLIPQAASIGVDTLMGESPLLQVFKPINDAYKKHQTIAQETYAGLLLASSKELRDHGAVGEGIAMELASGAYAKADPAKILKDADSGELMQHVREVIQANDQKRQQAASPIQMVKKERTVVGPHTQKIANEAIPGQGMAPSVT